LTNPAKRRLRSNACQGLGRPRMGGARTPIRYRRGMSAESVVRGLVERVWNGGHTEELDQFFASTFDHGGQPDSVAGLREWHTADAATWADGFYQIVALISD